MHELVSSEDARQVVVQAMEKYKAGDAGAPFERSVLQAVLYITEIDQAELQRLKAEMTTGGVSWRDFNNALKQEALRQKNNVSANATMSRFAPERISELESDGYILNATKGIVDINPNLFAKYIMRIIPLRITSGERFYRYRKGVWKPISELELKRFICKLVERVQPDVYQTKWANACIDMLKSLAKEVTEFDSDRNYINLANGMFNTETYELEEHDPELNSSVQNPLEYDPNAQCPRFNRYLDEVFLGDKDIICVVQEMMGYFLTSETRAHKMFILEGMGSNGKSVFIEVLEHLCGLQNVSHVSMNDLNQSFARGDLVGKTLNVASENEFSEKGLSTQHIKAISAGDTIRVELKYQQGFSYKVICKLLFAMNALPKVTDLSHGFLRRLVIIPFRRIFKTDANSRLSEELLKELPGVFNFAVEGLQRLKAQDFKFSEAHAIEETISRFKAELNPVIPFVSDHIVAGNADDRLEQNVLREAFSAWCRRMGETDFASKVARDPRIFWSGFRNALSEMGLPVPDIKTSNGRRYLPGLVLLNIPKPSNESIFENEGGKETGRLVLLPHLKREGLEEEFHVEEDDDDGEDMKLQGTDFEEEERMALEEALDHESILFDLNYLPAKLFHKLGVNEWLDGKPEHFDLDDFHFERKAVGGFEFISLR